MRNRFTIVLLLLTILLVGCESVEGKVENLTEPMFEELDDLQTVKKVNNE
ncbi:MULTISPECIES: hypothetical protein [Gracilibacillus]|uniref:Uncharacterized protein n=1 Tax=Gracilibacillus thailandensis TaxID=563735 RepID=A0A6N7R1C6_9BACI|nr:hypothetical protein [Gracilibacillus thailandensis]MRI66159.1 hypothetical protein [Gracilibacillus thailandensis]